VTTHIGITMNTPSAAFPQPSAAPAFTLRSALRWRGHDCARHCSAPLDDLPAAIWFTGRREAGRPEGTIVVVDLTGTTESIARVRHLLRRINLCARADAVRVLGRHVADIGTALSIVTRERVPPSARHLRLADQGAGDGPAMVSSPPPVPSEAGS
jgi:hypothetical protein